MVDFCKDCYPSTWGEQGNDFVGLITKEQCDNGFLASALCEGCGNIVLVDYEGNIKEKIRYIPHYNIDNGVPRIVNPIVTTKPNRLCPKLLCE